MLFINDFSNIFDDLAVSFKLLSDDIKLYSCYNVTSSGDTLSVAITRLCEWSDIWQLSIAVQKCFTCSICSYKSNAHFPRQSYMIKNTVLPSVNCVRDLGVIVDCHLKFDTHYISLIVREEMLRSRLILQCSSSRNKDLMLKAFFTYVRPILEYCSPVWSPHLKYLIDRIESVQKNYQKVPGLWNVPYPKRLELLKLQSLEYRCISYDLRLCYQSLHSYCDCLTHRSVDNTRSNRCKLFKHSCSIDATKFYFTNRIVNVWNSLPQHVVSAPTLSCFCNRLSKIDLGKFCVIY